MEVSRGQQDKGLQLFSEFKPLRDVYESLVEVLQSLRDVVKDFEGSLYDTSGRLVFRHRSPGLEVLVHPSGYGMSVKVTDYEGNSCNVICNALKCYVEDWCSSSVLEKLRRAIVDVAGAWVKHAYRAVLVALTLSNEDASRPWVTEALSKLEELYKAVTGREIDRLGVRREAENLAGSIKEYLDGELMPAVMGLVAELDKAGNMKPHAKRNFEITVNDYSVYVMYSTLSGALHVTVLYDVEDREVLSLLCSPDECSLRFSVADLQQLAEVRGVVGRCLEMLEGEIKLVVDVTRRLGELAHERAG